MTLNPDDRVRANYDRIAAEYARRLFHELDGKPQDRELLLRFAAMVADAGEVCDMGCGPGQVARFLRDNGVQRVSGLDFSPAMLEEARRLNPDIKFWKGDMLSLPFANAVFAGITAFYAIVNMPREYLPRVFSDMLRVLEPGGVLLLAFHTGGEVIAPEELWGIKVNMEFYHFDLSRIERLLGEAGFLIEDVVERGPYAPEVEYQSRRAYVFARKPKGFSLPGPIGR